MSTSNITILDLSKNIKKDNTKINTLSSCGRFSNLTLTSSGLNQKIAELAADLKKEPEIEQLAKHIASKITKSPDQANQVAELLEKIKIDLSKLKEELSKELPNLQSERDRLVVTPLTDDPREVQYGELNSQQAYELVGSLLDRSSQLSKNLPSIEKAVSLWITELNNYKSGYLKDNGTEPTSLTAHGLTPIDNRSTLGKTVGWAMGKLGLS